MNIDWQKIYETIRKRKGNSYIQFLLDAGLDINAKSCSSSMLSYAAKCGNMETVEFLVQKGADGNVQNSEGCKPLHMAAKYGHLNVVKFFISLGIFADSRDKNDNTALHYIAQNDSSWVVRKSHREVVQFLLSSNADINAVNKSGCTPLLLAAQYAHMDLVELFIELGASLYCCNKEQWTILHHSSEKGWLCLVRFLVEGTFNFDLDVRTSVGSTSLILAANSNHKDVVKLLIESGANVKIKGFMNETLLHLVCKCGWIDIANGLVREGCDVNSKSSVGETPLHYAVKYCHLSVVEYLIDSGADINCRDNREKTSLHIACEKGSLDVVKALTKKGCDLNVQTYGTGDTPLHIAILSLNMALVCHLLEAGADSNVANIFNSAFDFYLELNSSPIRYEELTLFLEKGAFSLSRLFREATYKNVTLCTQAFINKFNADLLKIDGIFKFLKCLPPIEQLKIVKDSNSAQDVVQGVRHKINTTGYCDIVEVRPINLAILSVKSLVEHYFPLRNLNINIY